MNRKRAFSLIESIKELNIKEILFKGYVYNLYGYHEEVHDIIGKIFKNRSYINFDIIESSIFLFLTAKSGENDLINIYKKEIIKISDFLSDSWSKDNTDIYRKNGDKINTSTLAAIYAALLTINNYLKSENIAYQIKEIRKYVYDNNITKATLMNSNKDKGISIDILLSVCPFGLFSAEDLVIVETVKSIEKDLVNQKGVKSSPLNKEDTISTLILSLYYIEKGSYDRAKCLLSLAINKEPSGIYELSLYLLIIFKLEAVGKISESFIIHRPYGNYNRYEPSLEERFPKIVKAGDRVRICAVTWPVNPEMKVLLEYTRDGSAWNRVSGNFKDTDGRKYWEWQIGPFDKEASVKYYIWFQGLNRVMTQTYSFNIYQDYILEKADNIYIKDNKFYILGAVSSGERKWLILDIQKDHKLSISIKNQEGVHYTGDFTNDKIPLWENYSLRISKDPFNFTIYKDNNIILEGCNKKFISYLQDARGNISCIKIRFNADEKEAFYGFGERYNCLNQRGNTLDIYVYNQYKDQGKRTYMPVPYFVSSKGYGIYLNGSTYMEFDMCESFKDQYSISALDDSLNLTIIPGSMNEITRRFLDMAGKPKMIPKWALGPWMSSNNWDSEKEVRKQAELGNKYNIPSTVLVIEAWSDEATYYIFNDAIYNENDGREGFKYSDFKFPKWGRWPDPKGLIDYLHRNNLKCILWQIPIMKYMSGLHHMQKDIDEKYMINKGYCVKNPDGSPYRLPEGWFKDSLLMDFSNKEGKGWWFDKRKYLVNELGIDGFKTDGGEFVFGDDIRFNDGRKGKQVRNTYPNDYIKSYYDFINNAKNGEGITFSRAGYTGAENSPAHWAGDERSTFKAFNNSLTAGLNASISGIIFWGWDMAGFSGDIPSAELYIRAAQMSAFCPIMQYHAESKAEFNQDRTPWNIAERTGDERALSYYRYYSNVRMNLIPYIYEEALKCCRKGTPLMKPLFLEYEDDESCFEIGDEYLFGDKILAAPVMEEGKEERNIYLPRGNWIDFWNFKKYTGENRINYKAPLKTIPVFIKENSVIPLNLNSEFKIGGQISNRLDNYENLCFMIYGANIDSYAFKDDLGNELSFRVKDMKVTDVVKNTDINAYCIIINEESQKIIEL